MTCLNHASFCLPTTDEVPVGTKEIDLAPHPVVGLVLEAGVVEKFPKELV